MVVFSTYHACRPTKDYSLPLTIRKKSNLTDQKNNIIIEGSALHYSQETQNKKTHYFAPSQCTTISRGTITLGRILYEEQGSETTWKDINHDIYEISSGSCSPVTYNNPECWGYFISKYMWDKNCKLFTGDLEGFGGTCIATQDQINSLQNTLNIITLTINNIKSNSKASNYWTSAYKTYVCANTDSTDTMNKIITSVQSLLTDNTDSNHQILYIFKSYDTECTHGYYVSSSRTRNSKTIVFCKAYNGLDIENSDQSGISKTQQLAGEIIDLVIDGLHDNGELKRGVYNDKLEINDCVNDAKNCDSNANFVNGYCLSYFIQQVVLDHALAGTSHNLEEV